MAHLIRLFADVGGHPAYLGLDFPIVHLYMFGLCYLGQYQGALYSRLGHRPEVFQEVLL